MAKNNFIIDESVPAERREEIAENARELLRSMKQELDEREPLIRKRQDFFEGRHNKWTNVVGETDKQKEGHIQATFNYILRFCQVLEQNLTNSSPKIKVKSRDESDEIETIRAESVEQAIYDVLSQNEFFRKVFVKASNNQIRDADFCIECTVRDDHDTKEKRIEIKAIEDLLKLTVGWDDVSGTSFSFIAYTDTWSIKKIEREFNFFDAEPLGDNENNNETKGSHLNDQYGIFANSTNLSTTIPTGKSKIPKAKIEDWWGYEVIDGKKKVVNMVFISEKLVQFVVTDYKEIPRMIGHSFIVAGKPWSLGFIDPLVDPQVELNDRSSEEGDLIRVGAHMKFVAVNMSDFDPDSIKPGAGQVIFIEGEGADFRPLNMNITPFPSETYINRVKDTMFDLGLPKIALSAGTAPYTGKVGAIQYQAVVGVVTKFRNEWEIVLNRICRDIQQYFIDYFPETHPFMREHIMDEESGEMMDGELIIRDIEFDWDNVLPLSRSDKVVDASTMRDRGAISLHTYLEEAGFRDASAEIKKLKKESQDKELMVLLKNNQQFAPGAVRAQLDAQRMQAAAAEEMGGQMQGMVDQAGGGSQPSNAPIQHQDQNGDRRGISTGAFTPTGQTATPEGAVAQTSQNINAQNGV